MSGEGYYCSCQGDPNEPCDGTCDGCQPSTGDLLNQYRKELGTAVGYFTLILSWIDDFEQGRGNKESLIRSIRQTAAIGEALDSVERRVGNGEGIQEADYDEEEIYDI